MSSRKFPKWSVLVGVATLTATLIFHFLPIIAIGQIEDTIRTTQYSNVPDYKLTEAITMWRIWQITIFQPLTLVFAILTIIVFVYVGVRLAINQAIREKSAIPREE